jgi:4-hydroxybutyryl-CoA dehydratase/vinylacetyl-CoA-Delta-isomerase
LAVKTREQYLESIRGQHPEVYMLGEQMENIADNRMFFTGLNAVSAVYEAAHDPRLAGIATLESPLIGEPINRFTHLPQSADDIIAKIRAMRELCGRHVCIYRCMTIDLASAIWATTYDIDAKYDSNYHTRFVNYLKEIQRNDWAVSGVVTDVKGDRNLRPSAQQDPDMYLRIVERRSDGIVVRGAKANITAAPYSNAMLVMPTRDIKDNEKDYAVAFGCPVDAPGITIISRPSDIGREPREMDKPLGQRYGHIESIVVFDDVFVPWENVFLCGETEFAAAMVMAFANIHRTSKCGCKAGQVDMMVGAAALAADYNGVERAAHIQDKLSDMIMTAEVAYSCGITAAVEGKKHPSGVFIPRYLQANVGKYVAATKVGEDYVLLHDIGGGLVATMPSEKDYRHPKAGKYMEKYLKGRDGVPTEHRVRALKLCEDISASAFGGWMMGISLNGAGSPMAEKIEVLRQYDVKRRKAVAKEQAGIVEEKVDAKA